MSFNQIKVRRDTAANWAATNTVLASGEFGLDTTNDVLKIGDGITPFLSLAQVGKEPTIATKEEAEAGQINDKFMTPLRTTEAISSQTSGILTDGGYLDNDFATQEEAEIGTSETTIMSPLRTRESITEILATEEEAAAGLVNNKLMTPLRTAEAIAELAQGGMTLNETVIVADYSLGLEDVGSVRLVGDSDLVEVVYEIEDLVTFNVNFTPAESTGDYVGYWEFTNDLFNDPVEGAIEKFTPALTQNETDRAIRVQLFDAENQMLADLSNPQTGITSTVFGFDVSFTGLEEFSTVNVSLVEGEGVIVEVRYIKLTFDNFPIVITIPTDETTLIPVGSEIEVVRSGDSNVLIRGEGVSVLPELQSYTALPGRPTSGFDSGLFFVSLQEDGNILRFFKDFEGWNFNKETSFPGSVFGDSLPAFELLKASRLRLFNSEDVLLADIANPLRIDGGMGIGFSNLVTRGEQLVENFYADLRFSTINLEKDEEGQYPASIIVSRIEVITAKNPFPVLPLINSNGNAIPSNGRAKLIKLRENEWSLNVSAGISLQDPVRLFSDSGGYVVFVEAKDNNSTFVFEKDHKKVPIFVFSNDIPLGGEITIIRNSRNASSAGSTGFYLVGGVFNGFVQAYLEQPTDAWKVTLIKTGENSDVQSFERGSSIFPVFSVSFTF